MFTISEIIFKKTYHISKSDLSRGFDMTDKVGI